MDIRDSGEPWDDPSGGSSEPYDGGRGRTSRKKNADLRSRVLPHNLSAEESLLGAMLLSREAIGPSVEICTSEDFYKPAHGHIYDAIVALWSRGEPSDPVTVADELKRADLLDAIGGPVVLATLQTNTPATSNAARYARIVEEHAILRKLILTANEIADLGYTVPEDVMGTVDQAESLMFAIAQRRSDDSLKPIHDLLLASLDRLESLYDRGEAITGVPTGFMDLDERLSGLQPSALIVIGARPAMGKTAFALNMATHAAFQGHSVLYFSLEMSHLEITQRMLCAESRVDASRLRNGRLQEADWPKINHAVGRLNSTTIHIDDNPMCTVMDIRAKARRMKASPSGLDLVIIDYLQLMSGSNRAENRQVEVSEMSRGLKILARELNVPVVALSQLSRGLEMRGDKRPVLADLRESGSIEQDADVVMFLYRDEVYNQDSIDKGTAEVIVAKHRAGPIGTAQLAFIDRYTRFANMAKGGSEA